ncbi:thioesterase family protein [uncultured Veillonella sp.]|uniref:thioesterase family protein n=1 Tax=uncultured Veillonella sp. TaxID=159268 RepID=UPI00261F8D01|nr:thioesterase family protein [uncultured Veillonella sp.]
MSQVTVGLVGTATVTVSEVNTAKTMKSGALPVFATPAMCALMEEAACAAISAHLGEGESSVGTKLTITHDAPSAVGAEIMAKAEVISVENRRISFAVWAYDGDKVIGQGSHERFIINIEKFMSKISK